MTHHFPILQVGELPAYALELLRNQFLVYQANGNQRDMSLETRGIRGIATTGKVEIGPSLIASMPKLEIISCLGAGCEGIDTQAAVDRKVAIATTSLVLAADVADVAMGLIIATARDVVRADQFVRSGNWSTGRFPLGATLEGARLGIVGLGNIGAALARRAAASDMEIAYHGRSQRTDAPWRYFENLSDMARWCRFLVLCCPGGQATTRLISSDVLKALGSDGYLINVARGSVVDEAALAHAVTTGMIAGAGLDVFEDEPTPNAGLLTSPRVTLLPHIGSATQETRRKMAEAMVGALEKVLAPQT